MANVHEGQTEVKKNLMVHKSEYKLVKKWTMLKTLQEPRSKNK